MERGGDLAVRLTGTFHTAGRRVAGVKLRVTVRDIPGEAEVYVTDVQLQQGADVSGYAYAPEDIDTRPRGRHFVNGTITESQPIMLLANMQASAPARLEVLDADSVIRLGMYRFGRVVGEAFVDGEAAEASQGWGRAPIITERCDLQINAEVDPRQRFHLRAIWNDLREGKP